MSAGPTLSVVVLAYNEETNIRNAIAAMLTELRAIEPSWELLTVDDGSSDQTGAILDALAAEEPRLRVIHHPQNRGLGGGYRTGFDEALGTFVTFFPADGQFPTEIIPRFLRLVAERDMVLGYLPHRSDRIARMLSAAERVLYYVLVGPMPRFQGILMFRRQLLTDIPLSSSGRGWGIIMELIVRTARGPYRVTSEPTELLPRQDGRSKAMTIRNVIANSKQVVDLGKLLGRFKRRGRAGV